MKICRASAFQKALLRGVEVIRRQRKERISWKGAGPQLPWGRVTEALNRSPSTVSWNSPP